MATLEMAHILVPPAMYVRLHSIATSQGNTVILDWNISGRMCHPYIEQLVGTSVPEANPTLSHVCYVSRSL